MKRVRGSVSRQQGAALMVTLVLLSISLLLGVSGFQNSRNEEAMSGNQRSSSLALMAAEYGASEFWHEIKEASIVPSDPDANDDADSYTEKILIALKDWADGQPFSTGCVEMDSAITNACYRVSVADPAGGEVSILVDGVVYSGSEDADSDGTPDNVIARRRVSMGWGALLGESLSALNLTGTIAYYDGINSQAEISGEEIDGYVNPAISVSSREDAEKVVRDILGNDSSKFDQNAIFIPKDPSEYREDGVYGPFVEGVYHEKSVVDMTQTPPVYEGNYEGCNNKSSKFCNYKGGVASELGTPILYQPEVFHEFVSQLVTQDGGGDASKVTTWTNNIAQDFGEGVHFVTNKVSEASPYDGSQAYEDPVYDPDNLREEDIDLPEEDQRLIRDMFEVGNGSFSGSGVLVVDGDVEFKGNPEFDGLIIVLGDYTIAGSGTEEFAGAIISSPYSQHYQVKVGDAWESLNPQYDATIGDFFLTPDGDEVYQDSDGGWTADSETDGSPNTLVTPEMIGDGLVAGLAVDRAFDAVGLDVSGGGNQDYNYSYDSLLSAFEYFSGETLLAWLVGQANLDGSYEYGLSTWQEEVVVSTGG